MKTSVCMAVYNGANFLHRSIPSILSQLKKENDPIIIQYKDNTGLMVVDQKLYYGDSEVLKKLQYYPLALLLIIFLFGTVLYFVFNN